MGKLMIRLEKQLLTEHRKDAQDCIKIYNKLKELDKNGSVWSSKWNSLTDVKFKGYPHDDRRYYPNDIGYIFLEGIRK